MRKQILKTIFLVLGCMAANCAGWGQAAVDAQAPRFEVAATYDALVANVTTGNEFSMEGGAVEAQARLWHEIGIVADVAGLHTGDVNGSGVGLDLITATFGPRYTLARAHHRVVLYGQILAGEAHGMNGQFPSSTTMNSSGNSFALQMGGGLNVPLTGRVSLRAIDANWLRTQLPNATTNVQNNLRLGFGVAYQLR